MCLCIRHNDKTYKEMNSNKMEGKTAGKQNERRQEMTLLQNVELEINISRVQVGIEVDNILK